MGQRTNKRLVVTDIDEDPAIGDLLWAESADSTGNGTFFKVVSIDSDIYKSSAGKLAKIQNGRFKLLPDQPETLEPTANGNGPDDLMQQAALWYAGRRLPVFPCWWINESGTCACDDPECEHAGKHPLGKAAPNGFKNATKDPAIITQWWQQWPRANIGMATGKVSGVWALDQDPRHGGDVTLDILTSENGRLPDTWQQETGSGGTHYIFKYTGPIGSSRGKLGAGLDIKGDGGYIILAPSTNRAGSYTWEVSSRPDNCELEEAPGWLIELLAKPEEQKKQSAPPLADSIPEGERDNTLASLAGTMRRRGMSQEAIEAALQAENAAKADPPLDRKQVTKIAKSIARYEPAKERRNLSDTGNALRFVDQHGAGLRYVPKWDRWLIYTGRYWRRDDMNHVNFLARKTVQTIYANAAQVDEEEERKRLARHALLSESRAKQRAIVDLAKDDPRVTIDHNQLDADPWLLNVLNGTLDLRTAELLPHDPDNLITKLIKVPYNPAATAPHWFKFLDRVMGGDADLIAFLQRVVGYGLTGVRYEHCLLFFHGMGRNGKSTLSNALLELFGDYGARTQAETLLVKNYGSGASNDLARLPGARLVVASEVEEGRMLAESLVKDVTGGDKIAARFLYGEFFEFTPQFLLMLYGNHKPNIRGTDDGIWRRVRLIPFGVQIPVDEVDRTLPDKLRNELPGILAWAVQGCLDWQRRGSLGEPAAVIDATAEYRTEQDILAEFLGVCVERAIGSEVKAQDMHSTYAGWAEENGEKANSARWLGFRLRDRGFANMRGRGGYHWQKVKLTEEGERLRDAYQTKKGIM